MPFDLSHGAPQRIAIVGGGIAGLSAAWSLAPHHQVTLYEAAPRWGGHARTVLAGLRGDQPVDTGFIVFNYANYPHLTAMFRDLDVPVMKSDMSFGVSLQGGRVEYALQTLNALYGQRANLLNAGFHAMVRDILRFNAGAEAAAAGAPGLTIGALLARLGLGARFRDHYLFPICGAIWSTPARDIAAFPAEALLRFMRNHALLSPTGQHQWWTVAGGSQSYVSRLVADLARRGVRLRPASPVEAISRDAEGVSLRAAGAEAERFDQVILACHADQALALLSDAAADERAPLGAMRFQPNHAVLHRDPSVMPRRRRCWSSWVYRSEAGTPPDRPVGVSYWMNRLQNIPESDPLFVTLNPEREIPQALIYDQTTFRHPVFDHAALEAQGRIAALQGSRRTWFAGAWLRNGFHEDGFASALRIARRLLPETV